MLCASFCCRCQLILLTAAWLGLTALSASEFRSDFSDGFGIWEKSASGIWEIQVVEGNALAALTEPGEQLGGVRRPTGYLLLPHLHWSDYAMTLQARTQESASVGNRDVVVMFGYVDDTHFYYAHISSNSDGQFHNIIMRVSGDSREQIHEQELPEARLTGDWHTIRITHTSAGAIAVYVDDLGTPLMTAQDEAYPGGLIGIGSFDDRAWFDDVQVTGRVTPRSDSRFVNIATRGRVQTGADIMIAGFVIEGTAPQRVLIRAAGPALADFGWGVGWSTPSSKYSPRMIPRSC